MADIEINDEELINVVRTFPELWNKACTAYRNNRKKDGAWIRISERLHKPIDDLKSRWKSIRDKYVREKKIMDASKTSGSAASHREAWELFESLHFLKDSISHRKTSNNMVNAEKPPHQDELVIETDDGVFSIIEDQLRVSDEETSNSRPSTCPSSSSSNTRKSSTSDHLEQNECKSSGKYKRPKQKPDPYEQSLLKIWKENNDKMKDCDGASEDPDRLFLLSLEKDFKTLNEKNKRKAKHALMEVLENLIDIQERDNSLLENDH